MGIRFKVRKIISISIHSRASQRSSAQISLVFINSSTELNLFESFKRVSQSLLSILVGKYTHV